jgi:hypothetical protein
MKLTKYCVYWVDCLVPLMTSRSKKKAEAKAEWFRMRPKNPLTGITIKKEVYNVESGGSF